MLPRFIGVILQTPPTYSAIKIAGERAYDLARDGQQFEIAPREITVHSLDLVACDADEAVFEAECGKGAYVRALARDLGRALGCFGHVTALRRTRVGSFLAERGATLDQLARLGRGARRGAAVRRGRPFGARADRDRPQRRGDLAARPEAAVARLGRAGRRAGLYGLPGHAGRGRRRRGGLFRLDPRVQPVELRARLL